VIAYGAPATLTGTELLMVQLLPRLSIGVAAPPRLRRPGKSRRAAVLRSARRGDGFAIRSLSRRQSGAAVTLQTQRSAREEPLATSDLGDGWRRPTAEVASPSAKQTFVDSIHVVRSCYSARAAVDLVTRKSSSAEVDT